jgi:hypothetical protein
MKYRCRCETATTVIVLVAAAIRLVAGIVGRAARQDLHPWRGCGKSEMDAAEWNRVGVMSIRGDQLMQTKTLFRAVLTAFAVMVMAFSPVAAVTDGALDGDWHPYVGIMVAQDRDGNPLWRCSGTLLGPKLFLTAGHCTDGAVNVELWFASDVESGIPDNGYPYKGETSGTPYIHPDYYTGPFYMHDLGIVILKKPVKLGQYGVLPGYDEIDQLVDAGGKQSVWFTAVGYGMQASYPDAASWQNEGARIRMYSQPSLVQINTGLTGTESLILSNNSNTGGTCFGDSGGPNFLWDSNIVGGVTSFGMNGNCAGTGGVYRVDRADDLDWIYGSFGKYLPK